jgi:cytochrome P450 family 110
MEISLWLVEKNIPLSTLATLKRSKKFLLPTRAYSIRQCEAVILYLLLGGNSLLSLDGAKHRRERRLLMPPFHGDRVRVYDRLICDISDRVTDALQVGKSFKIRAYTQEITLRVILRAVFGLSQGERYRQLRQLLSSMMDSMSSPLGAMVLFFPTLQKDLGAWSPWGRFLRQKAEVDRLLFDEIQQRRQQGNLEGEDILSLLVSARDEAGEPMSDRELRDELMTLLIAGHETTASALAWHYIGCILCRKLKKN